MSTLSLLRRLLQASLAIRLLLRRSIRRGLNEHAIAPPAVTSVLGDDQVIAPPVNTSGLNDHAISLPVAPTGLGDSTIGTPIITSAHHDAIIAPPVTDAASNAAGFLSDANTNSDQGLSLGDQNGLLTNSISLGNEHVIAPPAVTAGLAGDQVIAPPINTSGLNEHAIAPPAVTSVLGDDQVVAPPVNTSGLNEHAIAPPVDTSVHGASIVPPVMDGAGSAASFLSDANSNSDQASLGSDQAAPSVGPAPNGALSAVTIQSGVESPIAMVAPGTPVLDSEHLTDSTIVDGLGAAHDEVAPPTVPTAPTNNEHAVAPATVTSPALATSPTLASASLGGSGNDSFTFHPSLGSDTAQNTDAHTSELAHNNVQIAGPALAAIAPEFHQEFAFDAIHQDPAALAATVDQFHQMAANTTLLH